MSRCASCHRLTVFGHWGHCPSAAARHWRERVLLARRGCLHPRGLVDYGSGQRHCVVCDVVLPVSLPASNYLDAPALSRAAPGGPSDG